METYKVHMQRVTKALARKFAKKYKINTDVVPLEEIIIGIKTELEHGSMYGSLTNIIKDDLELAFKIALAHLHEDPRYYFYLQKQEMRREAYWSKRTKPSIFIK